MENKSEEVKSRGRKPMSEEEKEKKRLLRAEIEKEEKELEFVITRVEKWFKGCDKYNIPKKEIDDLKLLCNFGLRFHSTENRKIFEDKHNKEIDKLKKQKNDIDNKLELKKIEYEEEIDKFDRVLLID